ncbi:hypothetical protein BH11MYX4_BH11MYX4_35810 [soil metagenome]
MGRIRAFLAVPLFALLSSGCIEPLRPATQPAVASGPLPSVERAPLEVAKVEPRTRRIVFEDLFLEAPDFPTMNQIQSPAESRPDNGIFSCLGGPGGKQSALSEWGDPDGRKALWRISDLRWVFDDVAGAQAFHEKLGAFFESKTFRVAPCDPIIGEECFRIEVGPERQVDRMPHTEIGFVFRVGPVVAEVEGAEGPRVGATRIDDAMVLPYSRRAEARVRAATAAAGFGVGSGGS